MNATQYAEYTAKVERFLSTNNVKPGCHGPKADQADPFFSWRPCGCCQRPLGGDREDYTFATNDGQQFEAAICTDCVYFLAYGQLDDATMMEVQSTR